MTGGYLQLIAKGVEDIFITGDPQITPFHTVFRRYSNFAMETIEIPIVGKQEFGEYIYSVIPKRGDLLGKTYFNVELPELTTTFVKSMLIITNNYLAQVGIPGFTVGQAITPTTVQLKLNNQISILTSQNNFYNYLISQLEILRPSSVFDVYATIGNAIGKYGVGNDLGLYYIYQAVIQSSQNKVETDGTHNLIIRNNLSNYQVMFSTEYSNMTKGNSHVMMNMIEIVKAFIDNVYFTMFGTEPSELLFLQNIYNHIPFSNEFGFSSNAQYIFGIPEFLYGQVLTYVNNFIVGNTQFSTINVNDTLIDVFTTFFNLLPSSYQDNNTILQKLLNETINQITNLLDTPFYIKYNDFATTNPPLKLTQTDSYSYLTYYLNLLGPTVQDYLISQNVTATDQNTIVSQLTNIYNFITYGNVVALNSGLLWIFVIITYILNINSFISLDNTTGNLVLIKRQDQTINNILIRGDVLEYSDFFFGEPVTGQTGNFIIPSFETPPTTSTPLWTNQNLTPDSYWMNFISLKLRQILQYSLYINTITCRDPSFSVFLLNQITNLPFIADLTIASNTSAGFQNTNVLNNYNLYLDNTANNLQSAQHISFLNADIDSNNTLDSIFTDPIFSPPVLAYICQQNATNTDYNVFNANLPNNNTWQLNYYKTFAISPDVDPKMFRIRYLNGAVAMVYKYLYRTVVAQTSDMITSMGTANDLIQFTNVTNNANAQISDMLLNYLFPRIDNTIPASTTNDRTYTLFTTILNSIPTGIAGFTDQTSVNIGVANVIFGSSPQTLAGADPVQLYLQVYYQPDSPLRGAVSKGPYVLFNFGIPQFISVYIFWKQSLTGVEIFDVYTQFYTNLLASSVLSANSTLIVQTLIVNLGLIKTRYMECQYNKLALIQPDINLIVQSNFTNIDFANGFRQANVLGPETILATIWNRPVLSSELGVSEPWDSITISGATPGGDLPGTVSSASPIYEFFIDDALNFAVYNAFKFGSAVWYNIYKNHKTNYNNTYTNQIFSTSNITSNIGLTSANRLSQHLTNLINNYNLQIVIYNNYVTANTPINQIPILAPLINPNNIDYTLFGFIPVDIVTHLFDYAFTQQLRLEIDSGPTIPYQDLFKQLVAFESARNTLAVDRVGIYAITQIPFPSNNLIFTDTPTINNYYVPIMNEINTVQNFLISTISSFTSIFVQFRLIPTSAFTYLSTFLTFIQTNFYTIQELWNYFDTSSVTYITNLALPNQTFFLNVNTNFWNSISPAQMYNNLGTIEQQYPIGFRYTDLYISYVIQQIFGQTTFLQGIDLTNACDIQTLINNLQQKSATNSIDLCQITNLEPQIMSYVNYADSNTTNLARVSWLEKLGHILPLTVSLEIDGEEYESIDFNWLEIYYQLNKNIGQVRGYNIMIGNVPELTTFNNISKPSYKLNIPLPLLFSRFSNYHIPLICSQYQDIVIRIKVRPLAELCNIDNGTQFVKKSLSGKQLIQTTPKPKFSLSSDFIYLEKDERLKFAGLHQEYLVEYLQNSTDIIINKNNIPNNQLMVKLHFNNNCKYIVWFEKTKQNETNKKWLIYGYNINDYTLAKPTTQMQITNFNYIDPNYTPLLSNGKLAYPVINDRKSIFTKATIMFNGEKRMNTMHRSYYEYVEALSNTTGLLPEGVSMYSFALYTNMMQPSGSVNLSKIDDFMIFYEIDPVFRQIVENCNESASLRIYAVTQNILRYLSGMCGRAFLS
jgi:hypothetical protein